MLKESLCRPEKEFKLIDDSQNISDALTKRGLDKSYLRKVVKEGRWACSRDPYVVVVKAKKQHKRAEAKQGDVHVLQLKRWRLMLMMMVTSFRQSRGNLKFQGDGSLVFMKSSFKRRFDIRTILAQANVVASLSDILCTVPATLGTVHLR